MKHYLSYLMISPVGTFLESRLEKKISKEKSGLLITLGVVEN